MKAALEEFRQDIQNESREAVIEIAVTLYRERESVQSELNELRSVHTGIVREYQKLKEAFERSEADRQELIRQNQHLTSIRTMQSNELFGRSSEKTEDVLNKAVGGDDPGSDDPIDEDASDDPTGTPSSKDVAGMSEAEVRRLLEDILGEKERRKKEKGKRERDLSKLPVRESYVYDAQALDAMYGDGWWVLRWHRTRKVERIRSTCYLQVTYTPIIETMQGQVLTPFWKEPLIEKSLVSESLMASLFYDKYQMFLPYYRQEHDPERFGFPISRQLMSSWEIRICESLFMPLYYYLRDLMRGFEYQHCDETTWMTVCDGRKPGTKGYFWVHLSGELLDGFRVAFISFELTRSASHLTDFFDGIDHPVHLTDDAYAGYYTAQKQFPDYLTICGCLTHARRRYVNAMLTLRLPSDITREELEELPEYACIIKISKIYSEDEKLKPLPAEKRLKVRQETVKPLFNDFIDYVKAIDMTDPYVSDTFRDAVEYTLGHEEDLSQFLNDGNVPIDNGACERLIRDLARLRVNSLFSKSVRGAKTSAVIITLMQTAELNGADPYYYMKYIMEGLPQHLYEDPSGYVSDMMPWTDRYRAYEQDEKQKVMDSFKPPDGTGKPKLRKRPYIRQSTKGCGLSA